jgi:hypothetical protein
MKSTFLVVVIILSVVALAEAGNPDTYRRLFGKEMKHELATRDTEDDDWGVHKNKHHKYKVGCNRFTCVGWKLGITIALPIVGVVILVVIVGIIIKMKYYS